VVADNRVLVAGTDHHTVYSLDSGNGQTAWTYTAGGRIDSPPTWADDRVLFGSADGWVYCLAAETGELAWRYRAAPQVRNAVAFGQVESLWPVHGSVLVLDDTVYCTAGRQSFLNGGIYLFGLDTRTGKKKYEARISGPYGEDGESVFDRMELNKLGRIPVAGQIQGNQSDLLVSDGELIYLRHMAFNRDLSRAEKAKKHIVTVSGFLDGSGHHRSYWSVGERIHYDTPFAASIDADLLVTEGKKVFGTRIRTSGRSPSPFDPRTSGFALFAMEQTDQPAKPRGAAKKPTSATKKLARTKARTPRQRSPYFFGEAWENTIQVNPKAVLKAGDTLVVAGMPNEFPKEDLYQAVEGRAGGKLVLASAADGSTRREIKLNAPPRWDGMAAASGRLFVSLKNGVVQCFGAE
jgi:hypothetical protein